MNELDARLVRLVTAYRAYDAACVRDFGVSEKQMNNVGRAGEELNELLDAVSEIAK